MTGGSILAGVSLPLTGRHAAQGERARRGFELWREGLDEAGGLRLHGTAWPLELRVLDDGSSAGRAVENVRALLADGAELLFGPYGRSAGMAVASLARGEGRVLWNHGSSADEVADRLVVSLPTPASRYLHGIVDLAVARGCRPLVLAVNDGPFGRSVGSGGAARARAAGVDVRVVRVPPGRWEEHHASLAAAAGEEAAVVLCGRLDDDIATVGALRAAGAEPRLLGAVGAGVSRFGQVLGPQAGGVVGPTQWEPHARPVDVGPSSEEIVARYRGRYDDHPDYPVVQAWAGGALAEAALAEGGPDPEAVWAWALRFRGRTAYGGFALTPEGRQVGHEMRLIEWGPDGRRHPID